MPTAWKQGSKSTFCGSAAEMSRGQFPPRYSCEADADVSVTLWRGREGVIRADCDVVLVADDLLGRDGIVVARQDCRIL